MKTMKKLFAFLMAVFTVTACQHDAPQPTPATDDPEIEYVTDSDTSEADSDDAGARLAANSGKLRIEYLNNETELFRPSSYTVSLWRSDTEPGTTSAPTSKPTYIVVKKSVRSYVLKTVKAGWYIAQYSDGGTFKFQVAAGSDGLLIYNEHDFNSRFRGYFPSYGKIKVGWKVTPSQDANTVLTFQDGIGDFSTVWIYAEDGTTRYRGQYWYMPAGQYTMQYDIGVQYGLALRSVPVTIAPGKVYPYVKMN
jgi:hypothetical protein